MAGNHADRHSPTHCAGDVSSTCRLTYGCAFQQLCSWMTSNMLRLHWYGEIPERFMYLFIYLCEVHSVHKATSPFRYLCTCLVGPQWVYVRLILDTNGSRSYGCIRRGRCPLGLRNQAATSSQSCSVCYNDTRREAGALALCVGQALPRSCGRTTAGPTRNSC